MAQNLEAVSAGASEIDVATVEFQLLVEVPNNLAREVAGLHQTLFEQPVHVEQQKGLVERRGPDAGDATGYLFDREVTREQRQQLRQQRADGLAAQHNFVGGSEDDQRLQVVPELEEVFRQTRMRRQTQLLVGGGGFNQNWIGQHMRSPRSTVPRAEPF